MQMTPGLESAHVQLPSTSDFRRILVAVDRSEPAMWALDVGRALAAPLGARLGLVHVVEPTPEVYGEFVLMNHDSPAARECGEQLLRNKRTLLPPTADVELILREGPAADEIVAVAREWDADLLVMGSHARGRVGQLLLGSVARDVAKG